ncbi:zinc finger protein 84-like [Leptopilina boulardi]|uniref:zinc finger protein 84-like n=1 Tax=Leptopilina boulardi TaxID=63433 RepID=UPI0021F630E0|nr:zinc finger protein 84-like [Leptopilina boulardi]
MCDSKSTRFFRPWNGDVTNAEKVSSTLIKGSIAQEVKCEPEEDAESVISNDSVCNQSERDESRISSSSRSCSVNSEDLSETSSLNMLSNFVFNAHPEHHSGSTASNLSMESCKDNNISHSYSNNYYNSCPIYSPSNYLTHFKSGLLPIEGCPNPFDVYHSHNLHYGLTAFSPDTYASVEEAVKYIHEQDVAAKQMKKLRPKKFRCEHCNVAFSNNGQLKGHVRIHTGERPFKCDAEGCGKSFTRNEELTRHKRIHTGLRPHSCIVCGKRFGRKDHLKKHTRTHDNRGPYHVPVVPFGSFAIGHSIPTAFHYPL